MNLPHGASYYILSIFWFWKRMSCFLPSPFSMLMRKIFYSLLSTLYIQNTNTWYSIPFKVFYKVICSVASGQKLSYIIFYKHRISRARVPQLGDYIVFKTADKHTQLSHSVGLNILRATVQLKVNIYGLGYSQIQGVMWFS